MKARFKSFIVVFSCMLMLSSCSKDDTIVDGSIAEGTDFPIDSVIPDTTVPDGSVIVEWETKGLFNPKEAYTTTIETYTICEGTELENEITVLKAKEEGPSIFIIAGMHGDEIAGYTAIDQLKNMELIKGSVYILSPANRIGASSEPKNRYVNAQEDLNRSFPGDIDGTLSEQLAAAMFDEIIEIEPIILLDHHEARTIKTDRDFLGSSLIYTSLEGMEDLFLNMYQATQDRELCAEPFKFYSPGPIGSMNNVVSTNLGIPVITVETYRGYQLERRIEEHLAIAGYVLKHYEMVD